MDNMLSRQQGQNIFNQSSTPQETIKDLNLLPENKTLGDLFAQQEYTIECPISKFVFALRPLTVSEEAAFRGSIMKTSHIPDFIYKMIWNCVTQKPQEINNYVDFVCKLPVKDMDALFYGLHQQSYGNKYIFSSICPECNSQYDYTVMLDDCLTQEVYDGQPGELLKKEIRLPMDINKNYPNIKAEIIIGQPVVKNIMDIDKNPKFKTDVDKELAYTCMVIKRIEITDSDRQSSMVIDNFMDIFAQYKSLPVDVRKKIYNEYIENFGKYSIILKAKCDCPMCSKSYSVDLDIMQVFFRSM